MKTTSFILALVLSTSLGKAQNAPQVSYFPLQNVKLLDSPFLQAQQTDLHYILALDPDRLLAPFLREAGLQPKAPSYTNWENTMIPNLVNTVKGYATHEKETLEGVVAARSQATQIKVDAADLTPEKLAQYQKAQGAVTSALGKLLAITENYPDLKANQNFLELQAQLEGTENRINVARKNFNDAAQAYNTNIRRFPKNIFAGMFGFDKKAYFEAEEGSEKAPKVEF